MRKLTIHNSVQVYLFIGDTVYVNSEKKIAHHSEIFIREILLNAIT